MTRQSLEKSQQLFDGCMNYFHCLQHVDDFHKMAEDMRCMVSLKNKIQVVSTNHRFLKALPIFGKLCRYRFDFVLDRKSRVTCTVGHLNWKYIIHTQSQNTSSNFQ